MTPPAEMKLPLPPDLPWELRAQPERLCGGDHRQAVVDCYGLLIAYVIGVSNDEAMLHAKAVTLCVNRHAELVEALRASMSLLNFVRSVISDTEHAERILKTPQSIPLETLRPIVRELGKIEAKLKAEPASDI